MTRSIEKRRPDRLPEDAARSAADILRRVRDADEPAEIVRALGPQDLLIAHREADDDQRAELLALATGEQARQLVDLACWREDRLELAALAIGRAPV